jgi:hypothetical protein
MLLSVFFVEPFGHVVFWLFKLQDFSFEFGNAVFQFADFFENFPLELKTHGSLLLCQFATGSLITAPQKSQKLPSHGQWKGGRSEAP